MGKTTAAYQLIHRLQETRPDDTVALYFDCSFLAGGSSGSVAARLEREILTAVGQYLARLRKKMPELEVKKMPTASEVTCSDFYRLEIMLEQVKKALPELRRLVILVDEIECLGDDALYETLSGFRALYNKYHLAEGPFAVCVIVLCTHNVARFSHGPGSPYNVTDTRTVQPLRQTEWRLIVNECNAQFVEPALTRLFHEVGGQPYLLQRVGNLACGIARAITGFGGRG